jgi:hypothetical protein
MLYDRDTLRIQRLRDIASTLRKAYSPEPCNVPERMKEQLHQIKEAGPYEQQRPH